MDIAEFYTIETPPSSSTSKDSADDTLLLLQSKTRFGLSNDTMVHKFNHSNTCSIALKSSLITNSVSIKDREFDSSMYDDMHTPLRCTLGNTKLKTRQDVRRFRKFLKRNYNLSSMTLVDIDPDTMCNYLMDYLTSIRTRKGLKYDPETLRSYYLSIQRFLKDSKYPYCLRNSPQFAQCRDLIIRMRKEKNQIKPHNFLSTETSDLKHKRTTIEVKKHSTSQQTYRIPVNCNSEQQQIRHNDPSNSSQIIVPMIPNNCLTSTKDLLPSSSLPPRKRQQMKYFLEFGSPHDFILLPKMSSTSTSSPSFILSSDAYLLLVKFTQLSSIIFFSSINSSSHHVNRFEQLLDESPALGNTQRLMLTTLCHEWTGDIRLVHANLRPEVNSFLPHILVLNILSSKYSY